MGNPSTVSGEEEPALRSAFLTAIMLLTAVVDEGVSLKHLLPMSPTFPNRLAILSLSSGERRGPPP